MRCNHFCKITELFLHDARFAALLLAGLSLAALAGAYFFQYVVGLAPCSLCLLQRIPHALIAALGLAAFVLARKGKVKPAALLIFLAGVTALGESALAGYHAGVEQHWWVSFLEACTVPVDTGAVNLLQRLEQTAAVRCDEIPWSLFGVSMAGYNAILSLGMGVYGILAAVLITRRSNGF